MGLAVWGKVANAITFNDDSLITDEADATLPIETGFVEDDFAKPMASPTNTYTAVITLPTSTPVETKSVEGTVTIPNTVTIEGNRYNVTKIEE